VHDAATRQRSILGMGDHHRPDAASGFERAAHDAELHDRHPVVGERHGSRGAERREIGQGLAREALGHSRDRQDSRQPRRLGTRDHPTGDLGVVVDGIGVGHCRDGGEPTRHRSGGPARDRLFVLAARLAEVHVHVDQARRDPEPGRVYFATRLRRRIGRHADDLAAIDQYVCDRIQIACRIEHATSADDQIDHAAAFGSM